MFKKYILYYELLWRKKVLCIGREQISTLYFLSGHITINNVMYNKLLHTFSFHNLKFTWTFTFFQSFTGHSSHCITNVPDPATLQSVWSYTSTATVMEDSVEIQFVEGQMHFSALQVCSLPIFPELEKKKMLLFHLFYLTQFPLTSTKQAAYSW